MMLISFFTRIIFCSSKKFCFFFAVFTVFCVRILLIDRRARPLFHSIYFVLAFAFRKPVRASRMLWLMASKERSFPLTSLIIFGDLIL